MEGCPSGVTVLPLRLWTGPCVCVNYTDTQCALFWSVHLCAESKLPDGTVLYSRRDAFIYLLPVLLS